MREVTEPYRKSIMFKDQFFRDSGREAVRRSSGNLATNERNDCVVRAFMIALNLDYNTAHGWVRKQFLRRDKTGTYTSHHLNKVHGKQKNGYKLKFIGTHPNKSFLKVGSSKKILINDNYKKATGYTVKSFLETHPTGRYFLIVQRHAIAIVDGKIWGNPQEQYKGLYRSVWYGFECINIKNKSYE